MSRVKLPPQTLPRRPHIVRDLIQHSFVALITRAPKACRLIPMLRHLPLRKIEKQQERSPTWNVFEEGTRDLGVVVHRICSLCGATLKARIPPQSGWALRLLRKVHTASVRGAGRRRAIINVPP